MKFLVCTLLTLSFCQIVSAMESWDKKLTEWIKTDFSTKNKSEKYALQWLIEARVLDKKQEVINSHIDLMVRAGIIVNSLKIHETLYLICNPIEEKNKTNPQHAHRMLEQLYEKVGKPNSAITAYIQNLYGEKKAAL